MLNRVQLIGRVGQDLVLRSTQGKTAVTTMSVATTRFWKDEEGGRQEQTEWHRVVLWGKAARSAAKVLAKGRLVYVEGRLQTRTWQDDGVKRYSTEVVAESWQVLDSRRAAEGAPADDAAPATGEAESPPAEEAMAEDDDGVPF